MRAATRRLLGSLVLVLGLNLGFAGILASAPAHAAEGSPPVAVDDEVTLRFSQPAELNVLDNDSDPDGDELEVCRIGELPPRFEVYDGGGGNLLIAAREGTRGTFTFTYYACDFESLVPATVTVTVRPAPEVRVQKMAERPGFLRVKNTARFEIRFLYGSRGEGKPDGVRRIEGRDAVFVRVHRTRIVWFALTHRAFIDQGVVRNIRLDRRAMAPAAPVMTRRDLTTWQRSLSR